MHVAPFVAAGVPGTTREHADALPTALQGRRWAKHPLLLGARSPSAAFEARGRPNRAPGRDSGGDRGSRVRHGHREVSHVGNRTRRRAARRTCPGQGAAVTSGHAVRSFRQGECGSPRLPPRRAGCPGSAPSLTSLTGKRFRSAMGNVVAASVVVELFAVGFSRPIAGRGHPTGPVCRQPEAPHARRVARASQPWPPVRDSHPLCPGRPPTRSVPVARLPDESTSDRT